MIRLLAAILVLSAMSDAASADIERHTANHFMRVCNSSETKEQSFCYGYFMGLAQFNQAEGFPRFCPPGHVTIDQMVKIVTKYCDDKPEVLHRAFIYVALESLKRAFPCNPP